MKILFTLIENEDRTWSLLAKATGPPKNLVSKIDFKDWDTAVRECNRAMRLRNDLEVKQ